MHSDPEYTNASDKSMRKYTCLVETLNTTPELYYALKKSLSTEKNSLDDVDRRTVNLFLEDFEHSGVHLNEELVKFIFKKFRIFKSFFFGFFEFFLKI